MILQAYDFLQLFKKNNCTLQIGGSDQWGNIVNGVDLIRKITQKESFGLTSPLITLASGAKMGKTEQGAIWLSKDLLSPYDYWQFWRNTDDRDVKKFLNFFTDLDTDKINVICESEKNINNLKILLANETTKILHGEDAAQKAEKSAKTTFDKKGIGSDLPEINIKSTIIKAGIKLIDLVANNKIIYSKSEIRRLMANGGIKINNITVTDIQKTIYLEDFNKNILKLSIGKKKHYLIKIT